jgi:ribosomal protein L22
MNQLKSNCPLKNVRIGRKKLLLPAKYLRRLKSLEKVIVALYVHKESKAFRLIGGAIQSARQNLISICNKNGIQFNDAEYSVDIQIGRGGKNMKRHMPRAKGSADTITKQTSHIFVFLINDIKSQMKLNSAKKSNVSKSDINQTDQNINKVNEVVIEEQQEKKGEMDNGK